VISELRDKIEAVVEADDRKIAGLNGVLTKYIDVLLPLTCFQLLDDLKDGFKERKVCSLQDAYTRGAMFGLGKGQVGNLLPVLAKLGAILWFPHVKGAEHLLVLHPQWVVTALACIVREHNNHHNQLLDALEGDFDDSRPHFRPEDVASGRFSVELLRYVWGSEKSCYGPLAAKPEEIAALECVLVRYGLVCEVTTLRSTTTGLKPVRAFIVPPLLPKVDPATYMDKLKQTMQLLRDSRKQVFSCDFSDTHFLPKHVFERLVCLVAKRVAGDDGICESELSMAQDVALMNIGGLPLVMQLNATKWRIDVTTIVCPKFPHGARKVLKIVTAALQTLGHKASQKVVLHTESGDVGMDFLRHAKSKNSPFVTTNSRLSVPTAKLFETWIEPEQPEETESQPLPLPATDAPPVYSLNVRVGVSVSGVRTYALIPTTPICTYKHKLSLPLSLSLNHSLTQALTNSSTNALTHPPTRSLTHSLTHSLTLNRHCSLRKCSRATHR
jgi:hypothetical protein